MTETESTPIYPLDRLRRVADAAARAANAHNTQPWDLRYRPDHVEVGWRAEYALGPSDPSHRDLRLSLGTYIESLLLCAAEAGMALRFEPDYDATAARVGRIVPGQWLEPSTRSVADVEARRVWRGAWTPQQVPPAVIGRSLKTAEESGFRVAVVPTDAARPLLVRAYHWFFGHAGIARELLAWARLSPRHPDYQRDGLNDVMLVLNKAEAAAMRMFFAPVVYRALRPLGLVRLLTTLSSSATSGDGVVMVILGKGNDPASEVEAGRLVTRLWLDLFRDGIYVHPQSHVIDCPDTVGDLTRVCGARDGERPLVFFRVGYPATDPSARPRHPRRERAGTTSA
ncbi:hypothetical protein [Streptomyces capitiformicae]|uniref:Uncharacterized protein n=1 Tax=Streptomyces capitiformicae TaxID=2014920 RepID=A0A918ZDT0_9ACTN|nr:hypothetical protein [Streptomyces capitiformicae]GHE44501.1 hypothetical protein GCM10017771_64650 [Streptomyces capitiformicae]